MPCTTTSDRSSSSAIWEKVSLTQPLLAGTQTPPSWLHPGLQNYQSWSWPSPVWLLSPTIQSRATRAHPPITARTKPSLTPERCLFRYGHEILEQTVGTSSLVTLSIYLQKQLDRQWSKIFPAAPSCPHSLIFFSILLPQTIYIFPYPQSRLVYAIITASRGHSYH